MKITVITYIEGNKTYFHASNQDLELSEKEVDYFRLYVGFMARLQFGENTNLNLNTESKADILEVLDGIIEAIDKRKISKYRILIGANRMKELTTKLGKRNQYKGVKFEDHPDDNVITYKLI